MRIFPEDTCGMIVDMQERLMPAMDEGESRQRKACMLAKGLKLLGIPTMITQQYTKGLGKSVAPIYEAAGKEEWFEKSAFSCWRDYDIQSALIKGGRRNVVICGTEAHVCVLQTCIDLKAAGFKPILVTDAVASRDPFDRQMGIHRAMQEGVIMSTAESILFELTLDTFNPAFPEISKLIKNGNKL